MAKQLRPLAFEHTTRTNPPITVTVDGVHPAPIMALLRTSGAAPGRLKVIFAHQVAERHYAPVAEFRMELN